nr:integumentary mucin C.1-like [Cherax quadricarinatus]
MTRLNRESPAPQETHSHTTSIKPDLTMSSMASIKPDLTPICLKPDLTTTSIMLDIITTTTPDTTSSLKQENLATTTTTTTTASTTSIKQEVGQNPVSKASPEEGTSGFSTALQLNTNSNNLHKNIPEEL